MNSFSTHKLDNALERRFYKVLCSLMPNEQAVFKIIPYDAVWDPLTEIWITRTTSPNATAEDKGVTRLSNKTIGFPIVVTGHEVNGFKVLPNTPIFASKWCTEGELENIEALMIKNMYMSLAALATRCKEHAELLRQEMTRLRTVKESAIRKEAIIKEKLDAEKCHLEKTTQANKQEDGMVFKNNIKDVGVEDNVDDNNSLGTKAVFDDCNSYLKVELH